MDQIKHSHVAVGGLNLHVAEIGQGPKVVLFLHGFPEIWYPWRHQMKAVAEVGYCAIAIDFRGYWLSDQPPEPEEGTFFDLVEDVVGLLDALAIDKAFIVGKDFGAMPACLVVVLHPERVNGVITLGIPFMLPGPSSLQADHFPKGFYILRWQEPGRAEADFGRLDVKTVIRNIYILFSGSELPAAGEDQEIMDLVDASTSLPVRFSEEDLAAYASLYEKSRFRYALQVPYRTTTKDLGITNPKVEALALLVMGEKDYFLEFPGMENYIRGGIVKHFVPNLDVLEFPGMEDYIRGGIVKHFVPNLDVAYLAEGGHFVHEQFPGEVNDLVISFLNKQRI